jgi:hypothetical protein
MPDNAESTLARSPEEWSAEEAEQIKGLFLERRPAVPKAVVSSLWRYWTQVRPDEPPFASADDNRALALHARAFGLPMSRPADGLPMSRPADGLPAEPLGELDAVSTPLFPPRLPWGPMAALAPQVRAALSAPLMRAWVTADEHGPTEVLIVGEGLPEIRHRVLRAALEASLRMNGLVDAEAADLVGDIVGIGIIRLSLGTSSKRAAVDIPPLFDARQVATSLGSSATVQGALRDLVGLLRKLARDTNLVAVQEVPSADVDAFDRAFRALTERAAAQPATALLRRPDPAGDLVTLLPYLRTARADGFDAGSSIGLELSPELLETESYRRLERAYQQAMTDRLIVDAMLRRDLLVSEIKRFRAELEAFTACTEEERAIFYEGTVLLVERFDEPLGVTIRLSEPEEVETATYYATNVPLLIKLRESWVEKLTELINNLEAAVSRPYAPARQIAAGRFLDAALRDVVPDESASTARAFTRWCAEIQPMLWFEWRRVLGASGIDPADVFTRHTVLVTRYLPPVRDNPAVFDDEALLFTHPYTIVDKSRSAQLASAGRRVVVVRDATDLATAADPAAPEADRWDELVRLADLRGTTAEQFASAFIQVLRAAPGPVVRRLIDELRPGPPDPAENQAIDTHLRKAERATSVASGMDRARIAMRTRAFLTARQSLENAHGEPRWEARAWLLRAVVECVAKEIPSREIPDVLGAQLPGLPPEARRAVDEATNLDEEYTREWLEALPVAELDKGIQRLFLGLPRARRTCSSEQYAVLLFRRALEAVRLARELEEAAAELSDEQETIDAVLVKIGHQLEEILVGPYAPGAVGDALGLLEVLTGREPPRYGRISAG